MFSKLFNVLFSGESHLSPREHYQFNVMVVITGLATCCLGVLVLQAFLRSDQSSTLTTMILIATFLIQLINIGLLTKGRVKTASYLLLLAATPLLFFTIYLSNGLYSSGMLFINIVLILIVFLLGWQQAIIFTSAVLLYVVALYVIEITGNLPEVAFKDLPFRVIMLTLTFVTVSLLVSYHVYMLDVTQRRNTELRLQQERQAIYRQLAQDIGHDLRTPITVLKSNTYLIRRRLERDLDIEMLLQSMEMQTERLQHMAEEFDALLELESQRSKQMLPLTFVDLVDLLRGVVDGSQAYADMNDVSLTLDVSTDDRMIISGNTTQLMRLFTNLVDNAISYNHAGGSARVILRREDDMIYVKVQDDGIGIPEEEQNRIFDRFYRVDNARIATGRSGTGVGLSIVKTILDIHQGEIHVDSTLGQGTTMTISFKVQPVPHQANLPIVE
jgi:signal transduction histidine kinase